MSYQYKTKATALKHIENGKNFFRPEFKNFWANREVALAGVKNNGFSLSRVGSSLQDDKELVLTAIEDSSEAYRFASDRLKNDMEVATFAFRWCARRGEDYWKLFINLPDQLKENKELVFEAVKISMDMRGYISSGLLREAPISMKDLLVAPDPVKAFESAIAYEKLQANLAQKSATPSNEIKRGVKL